MKRSLVTLLFVAVVLVATSGCATTASTRTRTTAATLANERGASAALVADLQRGERLSLANIEELAVLKVPDDATLAYLRNTEATYQLTTGQVVRLREVGVSDRVIDYLLATPNRVAVRPRGYYRGQMGWRGHGNHIRSGFGARGFGGRSFGSSHYGGRH